MEKSKVYFIREISPESIIKVYQALGFVPKGKVAFKLHTGEVGNQNFIKPEMWAGIINYVSKTNEYAAVECNTAYEGKRDTTKKHLKTISEHGWDKYFNFDLMDATGPDMELDIPDGFKIKKNYVGKNLANYQTMIVLSHFKGHPMGGYGGALKQLSIGVASSYGKAIIHGVGDPSEEVRWTADHDSFLQSMADAASSITRYFNGNICYINVMKNMSVDCDCCAVAEDPCLKDIGVLASLDPVAIDQACIDLVLNSNDTGKTHFMERVISRNGLLTIDTAQMHNIGTKNYELVEIK